MVEREVQVRVVPMTVVGSGPRMKIVIEAEDGAHAEIVLSQWSWSRMVAKPGTNVEAEWHQRTEHAEEEADADD